MDTAPNAEVTTLGRIRFLPSKSNRDKDCHFLAWVTAEAWFQREPASRQRRRQAIANQARWAGRAKLNHSATHHQA